MNTTFITERVVNLIKDQRSEKRLTQKQMAKFMGVCVRTYQRMEDGNLTLEELAVICSHLDLAIIVLPKTMLP